MHSFPIVAMILTHLQKHTLLRIACDLVSAAASNPLSRSFPQGELVDIAEKKYKIPASVSHDILSSKDGEFLRDIER